MNLRKLKQGETLDYPIHDQKPVLFYFSSPNCGVCHAMLPKVSEALKDEDLEMIEIDVSLHPNIAGQHQVFVSPSLIVWGEGKELLRESRFIDVDRISRLIALMK
jgi:thioredoxin-like negative regulator of GroEL